MRSSLRLPIFLLAALGCLPGTGALAGQIAIENAGDRDLRPLQRLAEDALRVFERDFGAIDATIRIVYRAPGCLRVGYDFEKRAVQLCAVERVRDAGLESPDVLRHELFHAMLCAAKPDLCAKEILKSVDATALHEGLADAFARRFSRDALFGEDFYADRPYIRRYRSDLCASLVAGAHEKGNAIVSNLLARPPSFARILRALPQAPEFRFETLLRNLGRRVPRCFASEPAAAPVIDYESANYPKSRLHRFRIDPARPLDLRFAPNEAARNAYPDLRISWVGEDGRPSPHLAVTADAGEKLRYSIRPLGSEIVKLTAEFRAGEKLVGRQTFYMTDAPAPPAAEPAGTDVRASGSARRTP